MPRSLALALLLALLAVGAQATTNVSWTKPAVNWTKPSYNWTAAKPALAAANLSKPALANVSFAKLSAAAALQDVAALKNASRAVAGAGKNVSLVLVKPVLNVSALVGELDAAGLSSVAAVKRGGTWWVKNGTAPAVPVKWDAKTIVNKTVTLPL